LQLVTATRSAQAGANHKALRVLNALTKFVGVMG